MPKKMDGWNYRAREDHGLLKSFDSLKGFIEEKGENWAAAALVWGSIGYHTPDHAVRLIRKYVKGEKEDNCERCAAIFRKDLEEMVYFDLSRFINLDQDKQNIQIGYIKKVGQLSDEMQLTYGLAYPTSGIY